MTARGAPRARHVPCALTRRLTPEAPVRVLPLTAIAILLAGAEARAQFTTFVQPPPKVAKPAAAVVAAQQKAKADSVQRAAITDMKAWVDSAAVALAAGGADSAGTVAARRDTAFDRVDSTRVAPAGTQSRTRDTASVPTTRFRDGARAPNTASPLPAIALSGAGLFVLGLGLARRRRA
jgi:hypothetical protein